MKYYRHIQVALIAALIVITCLWLYGCDSFTETDLPKTQLIKTAVFQDVKTATAALSDCYAQMRDYSMITGNSDGLSSLLGNYADELTYYGVSDSPLQNFYNHTLLPSNSGVSVLWNSSYNQIYAANAIVEGVENATAITGDNRNRLKGEALFIRAFIHFNLVNLFGDIPYITSTDYKTNTMISKQTQADVYKQIIADLLEAKELLPETYTSAQRIRPNKYTVSALLARVYLYTENWQLAENEATVIINNTALYQWQDNLDLVFLKDSPSTIWQLHPGVAGLNTIEGRTFIFTSAPPNIEAISPELLHAFEAGDQRKNHWLGSVNDGTDTYYFPFKYKLDTNSGTSQEYSIIFRLEEQYLIRAEARIHLGKLAEAKNDINKIRQRATLANTTASTSEELSQAVLQERRVELFTEFGHRWFDLKRTGKAGTVLSVIKSAWKDRDNLLPLPASELLANSHLLPQNQGY
ncbi:RagB/SusD family nutrient uptake outer membrane protein [Flavobacterium sp. WC2429]|uniref:RagB/SusD family nutrient uptake outer membrane protein n=1 Tax=Flavobacterium sp. WC2429 TaxID=3234140 RepID=A0AB39WHW8_9FLAO